MMFAHSMGVGAAVINVCVRVSVRARGESPYKKKKKACIMSKAHSQKNAHFMWTFEAHKNLS